MTTQCPNCFNALEKKPVRKTKCPDCGKLIFVRSGQLLTEKQAFFRDWAGKLLRCNLSLNNDYFEQYESTLLNRFGKPPLWNDVIWGILNDVIVVSHDRLEKAQAYRLMAEIAHSDGRDAKEFLALAAREDLLRIQEGGYTTHVTTLHCNDRHVCTNCRKLEGRKFTIAQALRELPIPHQCTSQSGCRCLYVEVLRR